MQNIVHYLKFAQTFAIAKLTQISCMQTFALYYMSLFNTQQISFIL